MASQDEFPRKPPYRYIAALPASTVPAAGRGSAVGASDLGRSDRAGSGESGRSTRRSGAGADVGGSPGERAGRTERGRRPAAGRSGRPGRRGGTPGRGGPRHARRRRGDGFGISSGSSGRRHGGRRGRAPRATGGEGDGGGHLLDGGHGAVGRRQPQLGPPGLRRLASAAGGDRDPPPGQA